MSAVARIAELAYTFPHRPSWSQSSTAFLSRDWHGDPRSSRELEPQWFPVHRIPLDRMWDDARLWLPDALAGRIHPRRLLLRSGQCDRRYLQNVGLIRHEFREHNEAVSDDRPAMTPSRDVPASEEIPDAPVLRTAWAALGGDEDDLGRVSSTASEVTRFLDSPLAVGTLVHDAVAAASLAAGLLAEDAGGPPIEVRLDPARVATAVTSERWLTIDGDHPPVWAALSGFWPTSDGWLRTHANYPHHRDRLVAALQLTDESADDLRSVLSTMSARQAADAITAEGGVAVAVGTEEEWRDSEQGRAAAAAPLIRLQRLAAADAEPARILDSERPLAGVRVLDFTRVIAGPVATRTLALFGASVLRIDSPHLPEIPMQHLDTGADKESALLDLTGDRQTLDELLARPTSWSPAIVPEPSLASASTRSRSPTAESSLPPCRPGARTGHGTAGADSTASSRQHPASRGSARPMARPPERCQRRRSTIPPATCSRPA